MNRPTSRFSRSTTSVTVLAVGVSAFGLLQSLIVPVLSQIQDRFDTDQSTVAWVLTAYLLTAAVATPLLGRIGDAIGKRKVLTATLLVLAIGSVMAALAPSIEWMIAARVVQGMGGGVIPLSFGIIRDEVEPEKSGAAVGLLASLISAAFGVGIVLAGPIVDGLGYPWLFWLPAIATSLAAIGAILFIPESPFRTAGRIAILPALLLSGWLVALLLGVSRGNTLGWTSPAIIGLFGGALLLMLGWVLSERRAAIPLIDLDLMRVRGVWTANVVGFLAGFGTFASLGFLPQMLQTPTDTGYGFSYTISQSGWVLLPSSVIAFVMGFIAPRMVRRWSARWVIFIGAVANAASFAGIALVHEETWQIASWMVLHGLGLGCVVSSVAGVVLSSVPRHQSGVASGMNANLRLIGGSIGSAVMAGIITAHLGSSGFPLEIGYRNGFLALTACAAISAGAALLIPKHPGHTAPAVVTSGSFARANADMAKVRV